MNEGMKIVVMLLGLLFAAYIVYLIFVSQFDF